jgi:signal transduction histidine kinase
MFKFPLLSARRPNAVEWWAVLMFSAGLCLATGALAWIGYVATREWTRGTDLLLHRRVTEAQALVGAAISRDMKGAWITLLVPTNAATIEEDPPYDLLQPTARVFARFPYPESVFVWRPVPGRMNATYVFNRADRRPSWDSVKEPSGPFPVILNQNQTALREVVDELRQDAMTGLPFAVVDTKIDGVPYQVVAHLIFDADQPRRLAGIVGFTVNLRWLKQEYFGPLLSEVARIGGDEEALSFVVTDDEARVVAKVGMMPTGPLVTTRQFPLAFIDPVVMPAMTSQRLVHNWVVHVGPNSDDELLKALRNARRTLALLAIAAAVSIIALLLVVRAVRANAAVASMKSEFVSAVTHELKTPVSVIRLVGDALSSGRYSSPARVREYANLLSTESSRLTRSIDNLLLYAKYSEAPTASGSLVPTDVGDLVEAALEPFRPTLAETGFSVVVDIAPMLPRAAADRQALIQVMENLIDNAIKYSDGARSLAIVARQEAEQVRVTFSDKGIGIPTDDLPHVFERFYRGQNVPTGGSGLGLAIARRILRFHDGDINIRSVVGVGTDVSLFLRATSEI